MNISTCSTWSAGSYFFSDRRGTAFASTSIAPTISRIDAGLKLAVVTGPQLAVTAGNIDVRPHDIALPAQTAGGSIDLNLNRPNGTKPESLLRHDRPAQTVRFVDVRLRRLHRHFELFLEFKELDAQSRAAVRRALAVAGAGRATGSQCLLGKAESAHGQVDAAIRRMKSILKAFRGCDPGCVHASELRSNRDPLGGREGTGLDLATGHASGPGRRCDIRIGPMASGIAPFENPGFVGQGNLSDAKAEAERGELGQAMHHPTGGPAP